LIGNGVGRVTVPATSGRRAADTDRGRGHRSAGMNIFVLHCLAGLSAKMHCDVHYKMILETAQILYTAIQSVGATLPPHPDPAVKPYRKTHEHHPCVLWAPASRAHMKWLIDLGVALSDCFNANRGKQHGSAVHLRHMQAHLDLTQFPEVCHPVKWYQHLCDQGLDDELVERCYRKVATVNPPQGCMFGVVCIDDDLWPDTVVFAKGGFIDLVASYRNYYVHKAKHAFVMQWSGSPTPPDEFGCVFATQFPSETVLTSKPAKKQKSEGGAATPRQRLPGEIRTH